MDLVSLKISFDLKKNLFKNKYGSYGTGGLW